VARADSGHPKPGNVAGPGSTARPHPNGDGQRQDVHRRQFRLSPDQAFLPEQHRIVAEVERRLPVVAEVEASIDADLARAARLRQAILREAFAGRLVPRGDGDTDGVA